MKLKLLALALGMAALSSLLHAKDAKALFSKEKSETSQLTFFSASDTSPITLEGGGPFTPLTFTQFQFSNGKGITPDLTGSIFLLKPGTYYITFSGTFEVTQPISADDGIGASYNVAFQLGENSPIFINTDGGENSASGFNSFNMSSVSKVIQVTAPTTFSIVAQDITVLDPNTAVTVTTRSITIERFE